MNPDGSDQRRITYGAPGSSFVPDWSYDGTRIAYAFLDPSLGHPEVWVMNADGAQQTRLTITPPNGQFTWSLHPSWEPGDARIRYASTADQRTRVTLFAINVELSPGKFVTHGWIAARYAPQPQGPWSPRVRLFGGPQTDTANYPVVMNLSALHPSLNSCLAYSEPGSMVMNGDLYISLLCAQGPPATNKNVLIRSRDHGQSGSSLRPWLIRLMRQPWVRSTSALLIWFVRGTGPS